MNIRKYMPGEELLLHEVFFSSIHENATEFYSKEQLQAWAPADFDKEKWKAKIKAINPFVMMLNNEIVGYADLQKDGYIDHFFVKGGFAGKGLGSKLIQKILKEAEKLKIPCLYSNVSLAAQSLFTKHGFRIEKKQQVLMNGLILENALMHR